YENVRETMGADAASAFSRLYMAPGVSHCFGGPGPNSFDMLSALDAWVDRGEAPTSIIASRYESEYATLLDMPPGEPTRTRPLCPYPQTAHYNGSGSTDDAANFTCRAP
ncbi:MAG TPA: tannase/feruloyl esterase family alpha/beta hydrolase, partial [Verrucomicrobiae bacterium]|nr:tannase/feruloyl esterase family alpha/beta hydrolase [Verrucomicrobiae bacterium]